MRHLKEWQRYQIAAKLEAGCTKKEIAEYLGAHPSTITREIQRNGYSRYRCYKPRIAQEGLPTDGVAAICHAQIQGRCQEEGG